MRSRQKSAAAAGAGSSLVAAVKPIKASDEKTLESAIAMAHSLASKSMHDLDKKSAMWHCDPVSPSHRHRSPSLTPGSPTKRFFWFPSVRATNSSPKGGVGGAEGGGRRQPFLLDPEEHSTAGQNDIFFSSRLEPYRVWNSVRLFKKDKKRGGRVSFSVLCFLPFSFERVGS